MRKTSARTQEESSREIDEVTSAFGSQACLAEAIGLNPNNVSEWRRQCLGVPPKYHRAIWDGAKALGKTDDLPWWFPMYPDAKERVSA